MITVICGTNRKGSKTNIIAKYYYEYLKSQSNEAVNYINLEDVSPDFYHAAMYNADDQSSSLSEIQDNYITPANKFVVVSPEYNGSYPGILKFFLDACSIRNYKPTFAGKKVALIGVASGRAGNLRGMDHLTGVFHHVGSTVMPGSLPISGVSKLLNEENELINEDAQNALKSNADKFLKF